MHYLYGFIVLILITILYMILKVQAQNVKFKTRKHLPGPKGCPIFGNILSINGPLCHFLYETSRKYGPIFKFTMGFRNVVILSSNSIMTKTLKDMSYMFSGRWQNTWTKITNLDCGIVFKDEEWWSTQRRFVIKVLKNFGIGKERLNETVKQECSILIRDIEKQCDQVVNTKQLFPKAIWNIIAQFVLNIRFEKDDEHFIFLSHLVERVSRNSSFILSLILMYPILERFPRIIKFLLYFDKINRDLNIGHEIIRKYVDKHKQRFSIDIESENLADVFLKEQYQLEKDNIKNHTFTDTQLIVVISELFGAGAETTTTLLTWSMVIMAKYPEIQDRVYQELFNKIGSNRVPNTSDKKFLTYTQAVMDEILRFSSVIAIAIPHRVLDHIEINGFFVPKDSIVFPNIYACHRDEDVWEKPFEFHPQHFLTTLNDGSMKYVPRDELIPFGVGKRQCLGESLARSEFFVFFTSILQRFHIRFEKETDKETFDRIVLGTDGITRAPLNSEVVFEKRKSNFKLHKLHC